MKAIIMAAGVGSRLSKHFDGIPKCCIKFQGESLIRRSVSILNEYNINDITIVVGYSKETIIKELHGKKVNFNYNPFYRVTNSIASLWFAREKLIDDDEDVIIMNGDLFYEKQIIENVLSSEEVITLYADPRRISEADYRLNYKNGILLKYGKELSDSDTTGEYIGIAKIKNSILSKFSILHNQLIDDEKYGMWWEDILYQMSDSGGKISVEEIVNYFWSEIDYIEDYQRTLAYVGRKNDNKD
jgi:L-glutamine-phosphate cytidylyltransferase